MKVVTVMQQELLTSLPWDEQRMVVTIMQCPCKANISNYVFQLFKE